MPERGEQFETLVVTETQEPVTEPEPKVASERLAEDGRADTARRYGLPETASWPEISIAAFEQNRKRAAENLGLPTTTSMSEIKRVGPDIVLEERKKELGLPADATWKDVPAAKEARRRASRESQSSDLEVAA